MTQWFPITPHHPPPLAQVRGVATCVKGDGSSYEAELLISRGRPPHASVWANWVKGRATPLPANATPCLWQPQFPEKWRAPLPSPVPRVSPRMWSSTLQYTLADDAEAAELAREMEADRANARSRCADPERHKPEVLWWRDADKIRYEPAGEVSLRMAEGRIMRAVATCERGADMTIKTRTFSTILANMMASQDEEPYATSDFVPRLRALPLDIGDFDTAMAWFVALNPGRIPDQSNQVNWEFNRAQEVLIWRAMNKPLSFGDIGAEWSITKQGAMDAYARSIKAIHRAANGLPAYPSMRPVDQMAALRERNRTARGAA